MVSLLRRFNIVFIFMVCVPGLLVSVILSRLYISALFDTVSRQTEAVVDQITQNIMSEANGVSILASALFHDLELRSLADRYSRAQSSGERLLVSNRLDDKLVSFLTYSNRIGEVIISTKGHRAYYYQNYSNIRSIGEFDSSVVAGARKEPGKIYFIDSLTGVTGNYGENFMLSVAVCTSARDYETELDSILVMVRVPYLDDLLSRPQSEAAGDVIIYGRDGRVLLTSLPGAAGQDSASLKPLREKLGSDAGSASFRQIGLAGRDWLASSLRMEATGWTVVVLVDRGAILGRITSYQWYLYPALALLVVLFFLYAGIFFSRIANPIRSVTRSMRLVGDGDYAVRVPSAGIEELAVLTESFNRMVGRIHTLTVDREERERARMKAELEALRFQIDPHFVSNTLNSIRLMAHAAKADAIAGMTQSLMRILADSYSGTSPLTTLGQEMANLSSYVGIMKVRFGETFDVAYCIGPEMNELLVLRMIFQPIVENAILHGISQAGRRGSISVSSRVETMVGLPAARVPEPDVAALPGQRLVIEVRDDGVGMSEDLAMSVLEPRDEHPRGSAGLHRIGLANVHQRIRMNFGTSFGLEVHSAPDSSTLVRFLLPLLRREAGAHA